MTDNNQKKLNKQYKKIIQNNIKSKEIMKHFQKKKKDKINNNQKIKINI